MACGGTSSRHGRSWLAVVLVRGVAVVLGVWWSWRVVGGLGVWHYGRGRSWRVVVLVVASR